LPDVTRTYILARSFKGVHKMDETGSRCEAYEPQFLHCPRNGKQGESTNTNGFNILEGVDQQIFHPVSPETGL
jgi:hypothetical protein